MEFLFYCERWRSGNSPPMEQSCSGSRGTPVRRPRYNCALSEMALTVLLRLARSCGDHLALRSGSKSMFGSSDPPSRRYATRLKCLTVTYEFTEGLALDVDVSARQWRLDDMNVFHQPNHGSSD